ncbi:MAG: hypothetical protein JWM30_198 [Burkholderia sp.]|jgi:uncharacterized membrane protein YgcG|nr:hypothetical protein [Burkholderia sp.]
MNGKFIVYAFIVALVSVAASWGELLSGGRGGASGSRSGSSWSSSSGSTGSSGSGGHK